MTDHNPIAVSIDDACKITGIKRTKFYEEIKSGRIPVRKAGQRTLIRISDLNAYIDALPQGLAATTTAQAA